MEKKKIEIAQSLFRTRVVECSDWQWSWEVSHNCVWTMLCPPKPLCSPNIAPPIIQNHKHCLYFKPPQMATLKKKTRISNSYSILMACYINCWLAFFVGTSKPIQGAVSVIFENSPLAISLHFSPFQSNPLFWDCLIWVCIANIPMMLWVLVSIALKKCKVSLVSKRYNYCGKTFNISSVITMLAQIQIAETFVLQIILV